MIYDTKKIKEDAKKDFFATWKATAGQFPKPKDSFKEKLMKPGTPQPHPIHNMISKIRSNFLRLGFKEVENPLFIEEQDVYKQYGPEAPAILDRCFYLAGLPRPEIGLSDAKIAEIRGVIPAFDTNHLESLKEIMRDYKLGRIEGDDFVDTIERRLDITTEQSTKIISLFDELKNLTAEPTTNTLRSHMTAAWFPTLASLQDKMEHPIKLFSIGLRFRREQKVDTTHLRAHYGASCVVLSEDMETEAGKALTAEIIKSMGFKDVEYVKKKATSTYYSNDSEYEVFAHHGVQRLEVADMGMYSPIALANYDIKYPVFNAGFGIERILMIKEGFADVREVMYPQFYQAMEFTDEDIAKSVEIDVKPKTDEGKKLSELIQKAAVEHADDLSPCTAHVFTGEMLGKEVLIELVEKESGIKLLGPAAMNEVIVYNGGVYGIPKEGFKEKAAEIQEKGVKTGITYLRAMSDLFAAGIEESILMNKQYSYQFKMAKSAPDLNLKIGDHTLKYIQSKNKELMLKGPIFTAIEMKFL